MFNFVKSLFKKESDEVYINNGPLLSRSSGCLEEIDHVNLLYLIKNDVGNWRFRSVGGRETHIHATHLGTDIVVCSVRGQYSLGGDSWSKPNASLKIALKELYRLAAEERASSYIDRKFKPNGKSV